jgi:hypothetical protein
MSEVSVAENSEQMKELIIHTYIMNTEYLLSNEFWDVVNNEDRARIRACLLAANQKLNLMDAMESGVKKMLQES